MNPSSQLKPKVTNEMEKPKQTNERTEKKSEKFGYSSTEQAAKYFRKGR